MACKRFEVDTMGSAQLLKLKAFSLMLILPGLAGLIVSAMISVHYLDTMPKWPAPQELRTVPRSIDGVVIYQTAKEDQKLNLIEYSSVGVFLVGLGLGLVYLEKWGARQSELVEKDDEFTEDYG
jgi:uncharacterized membrane-anchored protein YitT (DUF2179 family)